jgi:hypothetical protein
MLAKFDRARARHPALPLKGEGDRVFIRKDVL